MQNTSLISLINLERKKIKMNKIFIYYSLTNNGDEVANYFKNNKVEVRKIKVKQELPKSMFFKMMTGGFKAFIGYKEKIIDFDYDLDRYDEIIIGSPIWFDRLCSPIRTLLRQIDLSNKKLSFVLYSASGEANSAKDKIKTLYNKDAIVIKEPKKKKKELLKIKDIF